MTNLAERAKVLLEEASVECRYWLEIDGEVAGKIAVCQGGVWLALLIAVVIALFVVVPNVDRDVRTLPQWLFGVLASVLGLGLVCQLCLGLWLTRQQELQPRAMYVAWVQVRGDAESLQFRIALATDPAAEIVDAELWRVFAALHNRTSGIRAENRPGFEDWRWQAARAAEARSRGVGTEPGMRRGIE